MVYACARADLTVVNSLAPVGEPNGGWEAYLLGLCSSRMIENRNLTDYELGRRQ
jgi:hypothetical protein